MANFIGVYISKEDSDSILFKHSTRQLAGTYMKEQNTLHLDIGPSDDYELLTTVHGKLRQQLLPLWNLKEMANWAEFSKWKVNGEVLSLLVYVDDISMLDPSVIVSSSNVFKVGIAMDYNHYEESVDLRQNISSLECEVKLHYGATIVKADDMAQLTARLHSNPVEHLRLSIRCQTSVEDLNRLMRNCNLRLTVVVDKEVFELLEKEMQSLERSGLLKTEFEIHRRKCLSETKVAWELADFYMKW